VLGLLDTILRSFRLHVRS